MLTGLSQSWPIPGAGATVGPTQTTQLRRETEKLFPEETWQAGTREEENKCWTESNRYPRAGTHLRCEI